MGILIVSDAWTPQVNGVVRTLQSVTAELEKIGHAVELLTPDLFVSIPCPTYPEIRLALAGPGTVGKRITASGCDAVHIATEGPLGLAARNWCVRHGRPFTTAYHTQFPEYLARRTGLPADWFWRYIKWFHRPAQSILVSTPTLMRLLNGHGLLQTRFWGRGVDLACFHPGVRPLQALRLLPRPIQLYVGRVAVEKNIDAFLASRHPGSKVVVGDGPLLERLKRDFPDTLFLGPLHGEALASAYGASDVFVFPSRTDTFGLVMVEALACGTPVAAFPVPGPADVLVDDVGSMDGRLETAIGRALDCDRAACADYGRRFSWEASARQFEAALARI